MRLVARALRSHALVCESVAKRLNSLRGLVVLQAVQVRFSMWCSLKMSTFFRFCPLCPLGKNLVDAVKALWGLGLRGKCTWYLPFLKKCMRVNKCKLVSEISVH